MGLLDGTPDVDPMDKYSALAATTADSMSLPETLIHGAVATVADIGATYWNSLTPEKYNVQTQDLLSRVDGDALQVYNENPDTIKAASFIGGIIAPVGLSIKGMNMLRAGTKGLGWFSEAGQAANLTKVETAFANAGRDSVFNSARLGVYRGMALNAVADNVAAEIAIVGTMSAHPFMEDYYKDFGSNFLLGVAFGTGIQTGIGSIIAKKGIATITGKIETVGNQILKKSVYDAFKEAGITQISHAGEEIAVSLRIADNLTAELEANRASLTPFTAKVLESSILYQKARVFSLLKNSTSGDLNTFLANAPEDITNHFLRFAGQLENAGLDKISFAVPSGFTKVGDKYSDIQHPGTLYETIREIVAGKPTVKVEKTDLVWTSLFDKEGVGNYIPKAQAGNYLSVADLGKSIEQLKAEIDPNLGRVNNTDWGIEMQAKNTAFADEDFVKAILHVEDKTMDDLNNMVVSPDHLPMMKAVYAKALRLEQENPAAKLNIRITKEQPSWETIQRTELSRITGVSPSYLKDLKASEKEIAKNFLADGLSGNKLDESVSFHTVYLLQEWIRGYQTLLRNAAAYNRSIIKGSAFSDEARRNLEQGAKALDEMQRSNSTKAVKAILNQQADIEGNVWLYRGLSGEAEGHRSLESYTTSPQKAAEFGEVSLFKVHVDDIVGVIRDTGEAGNSNIEILAYPPTRQNIPITDLNTIPDVITISKPKEVPIPGQGGQAGKLSTLMGLSDLTATLGTSLAEAVATLSKAGYGIETISLKTGTPIETIRQIIGSKNASLEAGFLKYSTPEDVVAALDFKNRALALSTNMDKVPQPEVFAKLNSLNLKNTSDGIVEMYIRGSESSIVQALGDELFSQDTKTLISEVYKEVDKLTQSEMKSSFFSSANQVLESFPALNAIATTIGKRIINIKNIVTERFEKPISTAMGQIIKEGDAVLIEANTALAVNASISGRRFYKDGAFWIPAESLSTKDLRAFMSMSDKEFSDVIAKDSSLASKATFKGAEYSIQSESVKSLMALLQDYGREMYGIKNAYRKSIGQSELSDIGLWSPSFNPRDKSIAYVYNKELDTTSMLYANSDAELLSSIADYENSLIKRYGKDWNKTIKIIPKSDQEAYNMIAGRHDPLYMQVADISKQHGGASTPTLVATDTSVFSDILNGYQFHVHDGIEKIAEVQMYDTMNYLKNLSDLSQGVNSPASLGILKKLGSKPTDPGQTLRNILLGKPLLSEHKAWSELQQRVQVGTDLLLKEITSFFQPLIVSTTGKMTGAKLRTEAKWDLTIEDMDSKGIIYPFDPLDKALGLNKYLREGKPGVDALTPRAIALGNGLATTLLLKVLELGQPLVNMLSLPILTSAAVNRKMVASFMGAELDPSAKFAIQSAMTDGIRLQNHPIEGVKWSKIAEQHGDFEVGLRQISEVLEHKRSLDPGMIVATEKLLESKLVDILSKPALYSEQLSRKTAYFVGIGIAKKAYPGLSDIGVYTFARNFMDEAIGNYTSAQRPAMFQGTFGSGLALFQTYMLTMAQSMYRQIEHKDWGSLGKLLLTQGTIFGASSLPGFHIVSEAIGTHFSDQHIDLETGTFRAINDTAANLLLYGAPSSFGPGVTTRGDIQPRIPNPFNLNSIAVVNITGQAYTAMERVAKAAFSADENTGKAMLEAISLQSVSRPLARLAELASGNSITSHGDIVANPAELYTTQGIISRILATRPLEEIKARETFQLNRLYGAADGQRQREVITKLKSYIRNGNANPDYIDQLASDYLRRGSTTGWRSAVNDAIRQSAVGGQATSLEKLRPDSPLNRMLKDLD